MNPRCDGGRWREVPIQPRSVQRPQGGRHRVNGGVDARRPGRTLEAPSGSVAFPVGGRRGVCGALAALSAATDAGAGGGLKDRRRTGRLAFCPPGVLRGVPAEGGVAEIAGRTRPETPPRGKAFPHRGDGPIMAVQTRHVFVRQNLSQFVVVFAEG